MKKSIVHTIVGAVMAAAIAVTPIIESATNMNIISVSVSAATVCKKVTMTQSEYNEITSAWGAKGVSYLGYNLNPNDKVKAATKSIQMLLNKIMGANLLIDGLYGNSTKSKVLEFQRANGLYADGIAGNDTYKKLMSYVTVQATSATISFSSMSVPSTMQLGKDYDIKGTVSCNKALKSVSAVVVDSSGRTVAAQSVTTSSSSLNIMSSALNQNIKFGSLPAGEYKIAFVATASDGTTKSVSYSFSVKAATTSGTSSQNENTIYNFLVNECGYNKAAACAILANIYAESGFNPNLYGDNGTSYGICQWHNDRFTNLKNYCSKNGLDYTSLYGQLKFLQYELTYSKTSVHNYLKSLSNTQACAYNGAAYFCKVFEAPANMEYQANLRGNNAKNIYWSRH